MKDMFDCLEEDFNEDREYAFLVKQRKNKRTRTQGLLFLSGVGINGSLVFRKGLENAEFLIPEEPFYEYVKLIVRTKGIHCGLYRMTKTQFNTILYATTPDFVKPVRKVRWWSRFKVWFSRKVIEFMTFPVDSSLPGED
jgi:hypothetical protein